MRRSSCSRGLPVGGTPVLLEHFRIDRDHSNAFEAWKRMGSPQDPTPGQFAELQRASDLALLGSPEWVRPKDGKLTIRFTLPRQAVSLLVLDSDQKSEGALPSPHGRTRWNGKIKMSDWLMRVIKVEAERLIELAAEACLHQRLLQSMLGVAGQSWRATAAGRDHIIKLSYGDRTRLSG